MLEIEREYEIQVLIGQEWMNLKLIIPMEYVEHKNDQLFLVSSRQIDIISEHKGSPIRLIRPVIVDNNFKHFVALEYSAWALYKNRQIVCLNPNQNYRTYTVEPSEILKSRDIE